MEKTRNILSNYIDVMVTSHDDRVAFPRSLIKYILNVSIEQYVKQLFCEIVHITNLDVEKERSRSRSIYIDFVSFLFFFFFFSFFYFAIWYFFESQLFVRDFRTEVDVVPIFYILNSVSFLAYPIIVSCDRCFSSRWKSEIQHAQDTDKLRQECSRHKRYSRP